MSFKCKTCGDSISKSGNYTVKVLPAKRIPKKARKLAKTLANADEASQHTSSIETNSFQKFLMKRIKPVNFLEITCGKCGAVSKIKMYKTPAPAKEETKEITPKKAKESELNLMSPSLALPSRKNKKKVRDLTAGLTISMSMDASSKRVNTSNGSQSQSNSQNKLQSQSSSRKRPVSTYEKQKDMNNLKKILFHTKKAKRSSSSLQDFLSGI